MISLAIVTNTKNAAIRSEWFKICVASIQKEIQSVSDLAIDVKHWIIKCESSDQLVEARWQATQLADYVCFVDDDDYLIDGVLRRCALALINNPEIGVVFTNERYIDEDGNTIKSIHHPDRRPSYMDICMSAQIIHHLAIIRTQGLDLQARKYSDVFGAGGEWILKASTALRYGAIHVPIEGYAWRKHLNSESGSPSWQQLYSKNLHLIRAYLLASNRGQELIPRDCE